MDSATQILRDTFGYSEFRHNQAAIIETLVRGGDVLTLMPTGGGKSLCFQIPALLRSGVGIVISPLIALMHNQVDALEQLGIRARYLNSSLDLESQRQVELLLTAGELDLLYLAPERLLTERNLALLEQTEISLFAIDEAHCVSQWGHDFRREYQQLSVLHERYPSVPRIALTATADERTRREIVQQLDLAKADLFINSFDRPNIRYTIDTGQNGREQLWNFLQREHPDDAGIVYCLSRKKVEDVAGWLNDHGRRALPYHAGLSADIRQLNQTRFLRDDGLVMVATIAFGMGIDKPDVRFVAHLNLPKSVEAYYQETGRAGRDGEPADAWMSFGLQDVITLRQFIQNNDADEQFKRIAHHKLEAMLGLCDLTGCRRQALLAYFGEALAQPCGNCDNCLNPPQSWDATQSACKALSCAYRTGQRFGVNYLIDVLKGKRDDRIERNGHDRISTFGIGGELSGPEWRGLFRQLISLGYLDIDSEGHGALRLTEKCRALLRGQLKLNLRQRQHPTARPAKEKKQSRLHSGQQPLFDALRRLRLDIAQQQGVPPYIIFHDHTLQEMVQQHPETLEQMRSINGVGGSKLERYGRQFLATIAAHPRSGPPHNQLSETINETLRLYAQGLDPEGIAQRRELTPNTIYGHFAEAVAAGLIEPRQVLPVSDAQYQQIVSAIKLEPSCEEGRLKPLFDALGGAYDYGILRCVLAAEYGQ